MCFCFTKGVKSEYLHFCLTINRIPNIHFLTNNQDKTVQNKKLHPIASLKAGNKTPIASDVYRIFGPLIFDRLVESIVQIVAEHRSLFGRPLSLGGRIGTRTKIYTRSASTVYTHLDQRMSINRMKESSLHFLHLKYLVIPLQLRLHVAL